MGFPNSRASGGVSVEGLLSPHGFRDGSLVQFEIRATASVFHRFAGRLPHAAIRISLAISERPRRHVTTAATASRRPAAAIVKDPVAGKDDTRSVNGLVPE